MAALAGGLIVMASGPIAFDVAGALAGVASQLPVTLLPAAFVALATAMDVAAGAVLIRILRRSPFDSFAEAVLGGLIGSVAKGTVLLFGLGGVGHFGPLPLAFLDIGLIAGGLLLWRPIIMPGDPTERRLPVAAWLLPLLLWSFPLLLQLASPVVPFIDVLPNHVAPLEHLRTYGSYQELAVSPSPIYGPSRLFLGYIGSVGSVTTLTDLPATLAVAAFALPLSFLLAAGGYHLGRLLGGPWAGYWTLMTVPLTFAFLRLPDARATVLAFPLAAAAIGLTVPETRAAASAVLTGRSRAVLMAAATGATILVHPVMGAFTSATVALVALSGPVAPRRTLFAGFVGGAVVALPQAAVMVGVQAPAWAALPAWPLGLLIAAILAAGRLGDHASPVVASPVDVPRGPAALSGRLRSVARILLMGMVALSVAVTFLLALSDHPVLLLGLGITALMLPDRRVWLPIGAGLLVGAAAMVVATLTPADTRLGESIHFEIPKSVGYWAPWLVAVAGGLGLGALWRRGSLSAVVRVGALGTFVVLAALPLRGADIEPRGIEEHRYAESAAVVLREAERGYWTGYPDVRRLVDADGVALIEAIRREQAAQRLRPATPVLHVAPSFQQWIATPLGVFTGVIETTATEDPEDSVHTVGGRLRDIADLDALLGPAFPYLVIEGYEPGSGHLARATASGYEAIGQGDDWTLLRATGPPAGSTGRPEDSAPRPAEVGRR